MAIQFRVFINPFVANAPFLYPLKTRKGTLGTNGLIKTIDFPYLNELIKIAYSVDYTFKLNLKKPKSIVSF